MTRGERFDAAAERNAMRTRIAAVAFEDAAVARAFSNASERLLAALESAGARPHATIVKALCEHENLDDDVENVVLQSIDALQVAIDIADNIADDEGDATVDGRTGYPPELLPTLVCLPALLISRSVHALCCIEGGGPYASKRVLSTLEVMAGGQSKSGTEKIRATSGEQGMLVCIPLWLKGEDRQRDVDRAIEEWGRALGETWERLLQALDEDKPLVRARYHNAVQRLMEAWPNEVAFERNGPLGVYALGFGRPIEADD